MPLNTKISVARATTRWSCHWQHAKYSANTLYHSNHSLPPLEKGLWFKTRLCFITLFKFLALMHAFPPTPSSPCLLALHPLLSISLFLSLSYTHIHPIIAQENINLTSVPDWAVDTIITVHQMKELVSLFSSPCNTFRSSAISWLASAFHLHTHMDMHRYTIHFTRLQTIHKNKYITLKIRK